MAKVKIMLCDDEGNVIKGAKTKEYTLEVGNEILDEIEAAVEEFRLKALPELESELLNLAQDQVSERVKKTEKGSVTEEQL